MAPAVSGHLRSYEAAGTTANPENARPIGGGKSPADQDCVKNFGPRGAQDHGC